ncbi:hypothetical protein DS745_11905 [Anaerobacillus alkaliphilus]|uniref:Uncharacterized protein n=1 Tax=Anaerobacillus alkaliphilus TaxID=1548597 RepID=A0A4Q0VRZ0_9BACI|nr:hypothetical protein [Anaerobacillus alkaliphilus]RXJ00231.1 hypothetical protein DS745_11905 [Anaerobacillus alkaliphilus]
MMHNWTMYLNMAIGTVGIILVFLGLFEFVNLVEDIKGLILILVGLTIIIHYVYHLEKKAGISNKIIWVRAIILILVIYLVYYFL